MKLLRAPARRPADPISVTALLAVALVDVVPGPSVTLFALFHRRTDPHGVPVRHRAGCGVGPAESDRPGMPLGLEALAEHRPGRYSCTLAPGDRVLFHTDGLVEARDPAGRFYPLGTRTGLLRGDSVSAGLDRLRSDVHRHAVQAGPDDDSALLLLEYAGDSGPPPRRELAIVGASEAAECEVCVVTDCPISPLLRSRHSPLPSPGSPEEAQQSCGRTGRGGAPASRAV